MSKIHPKVLAGFIVGHIATLLAVVLALFKVFPADPKLVAFLGEAMTLTTFGAGYGVKGPDSALLGKLGGILGEIGNTLSQAAPAPVTVNFHAPIPPESPPVPSGILDLSRPAAADIPAPVPAAPVTP